MVMSELSVFRECVIRGVSQHLKCERGRVQDNVDMCSQYIDTYVISDEPKAVSLEYVQEILEHSKHELDEIEFYYKTPYVYTTACLSEIYTLMQHDEVTYGMVSTIASCIFVLMRMSCVCWVRGVDRPVFCRWLWDHWSEITTPINLDSTWVVMHAISHDFMLAWHVGRLPAHPVPIPVETVSK